MRLILNAFRRTTNSNFFIPQIDGLRFYAIMTVVVFHLNTAFSRQIGLIDLGISQLGGKGSFTAYGWWMVRLDLGVKVFFAISGFVLALPFFRHYLLNSQKVNLIDYFRRRLTRLEPPFITSLTVFLFVHVFILKDSFSNLSASFLAGLFYSHVIFFGIPNPINPVTWSLETEAQFYFVVPFLFMLLYAKKEWKSQVFFLLILFVGSVFLRRYIQESDLDHLSLSIFVYLGNFLVGIIFCYFYIVNSFFFNKKNYLFDFLGILCVWGQFYFYQPQFFWFNNVVFNVFIFGMFLTAFKGRFLSWFYSHPIIYVIGGMCYSIYLIHYAFFHLLVQITSYFQTGLGYSFDLLLQMVICIPIMLMVSGFFYLIIEKPCMNKNWPRHLIVWVKNKLA
jgi:peptidoglycan/LPS O-acetylase OafA/YrhL